MAWGELSHPRPLCPWHLPARPHPPNRTPVDLGGEVLWLTIIARMFINVVPSFGCGLLWLFLDLTSIRFKFQRHSRDEKDRGASHVLYVDDLLFEVFLCVLRCYHVPERFDQVLRYRPALRPLGTTAVVKARRAQGPRTPTSPHERYVPRRTNSSARGSETTDSSCYSNRTWVQR